MARGLNAHSRSTPTQERSELCRSHLHDVTGYLVLRPTTRAIRLVAAGRIVEELKRPQVPPTIDALVLRDRPLRIAVKVRDMVSPLQLALREQLKDPRAMAYANDTIRAHSRGADPCWMLIPDARGAEGDQGAPLELTLMDAFHRWRFRYAR